MSSQNKATTQNLAGKPRTPTSNDATSKIYLFALFGVAVAAFFLFSLNSNPPENQQPTKILSAREKFINSIPKRQYLIYTSEKMTRLITEALEFGSQNTQALLAHAVAIANATEALQTKGDEIPDSVKNLILHSLLFQSEDAHIRLVRELLLQPLQEYVSSSLELKAAARIVLEDKHGADYLLFAPAVITVTSECGEDAEDDDDDDDEVNSKEARAKRSKKNKQEKKTCIELAHGFSSVMYKDSRTAPFMQLLQGTSLTPSGAFNETGADQQKAKKKKADPTKPFSYMEFLSSEAFFPHNHLILLEERAKIHFLLQLTELMADTEIYKKTRQIYESIFFNKQLERKEGNFALGILWNGDMGKRSFDAIHENLEKLKAIVSKE